MCAGRVPQAIRIFSPRTCCTRLACERPGLLAPSEVLVAAGLDESVAKGWGAQPIADGVAVDADELSGGGSGGTGGQQSDDALLGRGEVVAGRHGRGLLTSRGARVRAEAAGLRREVVDGAGDHFFGKR